MKKILLLLISFIISGGIYAQVTYRDLTLEEALKVAEKEGKLVFVDFTAPWCCGCKLIEGELKKAKEFGQIMNSLFVCIQADVDTKYGRELREKYIVPSLPTYLYIRPDGTVQHQFGGGSNIEYFVQKFWRGLDPYNNYLYYKTHYDAGERNKEFLKRYIECLEEMGWDQEKDKIKDVLWNKCSDQEKMNLFSMFFHTWLEEDSKEIQHLIANKEAYRSVNGETNVNNILLAPIERELSKIIKRDTVWSKNNLKKLEKEIAERGGEANKALNLQMKLCYAICLGKENDVIKICEKELNILNQPKLERLKYHILLNCSKTAKEKGMIEAWIQVCKKYLPTMNNIPIFGYQEQLKGVIKDLEEKL